MRIYFNSNYQNVEKWELKCSIDERFPYLEKILADSMYRCLTY